MADRSDGHAGHIHGGARHLHRQCVLAAYCRQPLRQPGRVHLGPDELPGFQRDHSSDQRLALHHHWPQALLHDVRRAVYGQQFSVRTCAEPGHADFLSSFAGRWRRRAAAQRAGHPCRYVSRIQARHGVRRLWNGRRARAGDRPDARRIHHGQLQLALDFLYQRADRLAFAVPDQSPGRRPAVPETRAGAKKGHPRRLCGPWTDHPRHRQFADRARQGAGVRLVFLALDYHAGDRCGLRVPGLDRLGVAPPESRGGHPLVSRGAISRRRCFSVLRWGSCCTARRS